MPDDAFAHSRRRFLQGLSGVAGLYGVAAGAPWLGPALAADRGDRSRVRVGLIGVGDRGRALLLNLQQSRNCSIAAVCDDYAPNLAHARKLAGRGVIASDDYRRLLDAKGLDAVVIATPLTAHARMTVDALDAGLHVFCEKAMARTVEDCTAMVRSAQGSGRILQIGHQRMFKPTYLNALARIRAGEIGRPVQMRAYWHRNDSWRRPVPPGSGLERRINWRLYRDLSAGLMTELASHQVQVANWFFDAVPTRVIGSGSISYWRDGREVYDHVALVYEYDDGRKLLYDSLISNQHHGLEEQVMGEKGTIEAERGRLYPEAPEPVPALQRMVKEVERGVKRPIPIGGATWAPELAREDAGIPLGEGEYDETLLQLEGFGEAVKAGRPLPGLLREGYHASVAVLLGERAMDRRVAVDWPAALTLPKSFAA
jgi:predicted dehydrogenase